MKHLQYRLTLVSGLTLAVGLLVGHPAHAATTFNVTNCSNDSQLQAAVSAANSDNAGDIVTFSCSGDIPLTSTLSITGSMTLDGGAQAVTLDGQHQRQVLSVSGGVTLSVNALTIAHGSADIAGGGIDNSGTLSITNSTFFANQAMVGGGIANSGTVSITNSTFSGNTAVLTTQVFSGVGGGIANVVGTLSITNSTFSGNHAGDSGGGIASFAALSIAGSIVADNTGGDCEVSGLTDQGYNLESGTSCGFTGTGSLQNTDAKLDPNGLQNNSGPTQTLALEPDSPAVDRIPTNACLVTTDQRGVTRPQGPKCDIGAFELTAATVVIDGCDSHVPNAILPGGDTITDRILECATGARNHGAFVSCVSHLTNDLKKAGVITGAQKGAIQGCAGQASIL